MSNKTDSTDPCIVAVYNSSNSSVLGANSLHNTSCHSNSPHGTNNQLLSTQLEIPAELRFGEAQVVPLVVYFVLFCVAAVGNLTVFCTLYRNRHRKSRVNLFIMHLSVADMIGKGEKYALFLILVNFYSRR